jgi:hypothetical protein
MASQPPSPTRQFGPLSSSASVISANPLFLNPTSVHLAGPVHPIANLATTKARVTTTLEDSAVRDKFGLAAIVALASSQAGFDLTTLGLNLNATHPIWRSLVSPFNVDEASQLKVARHEFATPATFAGFDFRPAPEQLRSAPVDALFFAFLAAPQDALQAAAADELRLRGWTWTQGRWLSRDGLQVLDPAEWTANPKP